MEQVIFSLSLSLCCGIRLSWSEIVYGLIWKTLPAWSTKTDGGGFKSEKKILEGNRVLQVYFLERFVKK